CPTRRSSDLPPVNWLPRISRNKRLHRRRNTLRNNPLRTTPKRRQKLRRNTNNMLRWRNLIHRLQTAIINNSATTCLLRIRVKKHHIKIVALISDYLNKQSENVIHRLRARGDKGDS